MLIVAMVINSALVNRCGVAVLLILTVIITGGNITWTVFQFKNFLWDDCPENAVFMIINVCIGVLLYVIILFQTRQDASILTSSIVWGYSLYLQWTALSANTDPKCNPNLGKAGTTTAQLCTGIFFTFVALFMISSMSKKNENQAAAA